VRSPAGTVQKLQSLPNPGDLVRLRRGDWRVLSVTAHTDCAAVHLAGVGTANIGRRQAVLVPFDRLVPLGRRGQPRVVTLDRWLDGARLLEAGRLARGRLVTAATARIDLLQYQLEPALALERGDATRLMIADEVGLGKTIQAGLILAELRAREPAARALVVTPAGLRDQWAEELANRFAIAPVILDAPALGRTVASLPAGVNPWEASPVIITSLDFVKQPEICRALDTTIWDLLIVDEAHMAATARERRLAVDGLGVRARRVVLLTATPHTGDDESYASLCRIGQLEGEGPVIFFRRTTAAVGSGRDRRVRLLRVSLTPAEKALHTLLGHYSRQVWMEATGDRAAAARLAMIVLRKRALSSMAAVTRSLAHRLEHLAERDDQSEVQLCLPLLDDSEGEFDADDDVSSAVLSTPGLSDTAAEHRWLADILEAARTAMAQDSKAAVLARLLRRINEPAIVFTEYRDTALAIGEALATDASTAVLHGGLDRAARREVERHFINGRIRILVATDAAGQGLNFQAACRCVVNLELPWNPVRLEQRIGRVDRIGQRRRVHAVSLVAGGTAEEAILGRLVDRLARIHDAIGDDIDPLGLTRRIAEAAIASDPPSADQVAPLCRSAGRPVCPTSPRDRVVLPARDLADVARTEAGRLHRLRQILQSRGRSAGVPAPRLSSSLETSAPWGAFALEAHGFAPGIIAVFRTRLVDGRGHLVEEMLLTLHAAVEALWPAARTADDRAGALARIVGAVMPALGERVRLAADARLAALVPQVAEGSRRAREREAGIAALVSRQFNVGPTRVVQAGLFDQRRLRQAAAQRLAWSRLHVELDERRVGHERAELLSVASPPEPMLLLWIRPGW
jgi:superfamily II DNA or RNA helicase